MNRDWKQGDVAVVAGADPAAEGVLAIWQGNQWATCTGRYFNDWQVNVRRQLVVIDPENREHTSRLADLFCAARWSHIEGSDECDPLTRSSMREALAKYVAPKPPRPAEPTGLGAVVEDVDGELWVRDKTTTTARHWKRARGQMNGQRVGWDQFTPIAVLSHGWQPQGATR